MRPLLFILLILPAVLWSRQQHCMGLTIELNSRFSLQQTVDRCLLRSFPGDDFFVTIRKIPSEKPVFSLPDSMFSQGSKSRVTINGREYLRWLKQDTVNGNRVTTLIYIFNHNKTTYSVWISYKTSAETEKLFSGIFFTPTESE